MADAIGGRDRFLGDLVEMGGLESVGRSGHAQRRGNLPVAATMTTFGPIPVCCVLQNVFRIMRHSLDDGGIKAVQQPVEFPLGATDGDGTALAA